MTYIPLRFGVQVFFFISGFLYANRQIISAKKFYKAQCTKIIIPTVLMLLSGIFLCLLFAPAVDTPIDWLTYGADEIWGQGQLWFIPFILLCYLLLPVINAACDKTNDNRRKAIALLIFVGIIELSLYFLTALQFCIIVFEIGYLTQKFNFGAKLKKHRKLAVFCGILCFAAVALSYYLLHNRTSSDVYVLIKLILAGEMLCAALLALSFSTVILLLFEWMNYRQAPKFLQISDKYSFYLYLTHHIFCMGPVSALNVLPTVIQNAVLLIICLIYSTITLQYLSNKLIVKIRK